VKRNEALDRLQVGEGVVAGDAHDMVGADRARALDVAPQHVVLLAAEDREAALLREPGIASLLLKSLFR